MQQRRVRDARDFENWIAKARPGERTVYHRGHLARDRRADKGLAQLAETVYLAGEIDRIYRSSPCYHVRYEDRGKKLVRLTQQRDHDGEGWIYLAERI